jgi:LytTr DNA-binding domain
MLPRRLRRWPGSAGSALPLERIFVRDGASVIPLALDAIEHIEAQDDYVVIYAGGRRHLVSLRVAELEARLPNPPFLRVHRSHIVNLDHVERMVSLDDSRLEVRMKSGAKVPVSRLRSQEIRRRARCRSPPRCTMRFASLLVLSALAGCATASRDCDQLARERWADTAQTRRGAAPPGRGRQARG